ncbi:TonB-dependent receptor domain-containing protein [Flavobacterium silvaticum]|uniref:TonB-dependent receptor n=1 Tax=Flavobacterium silvaticum TaxID=1852020 RepID=A0A972G096_9FLAO|nr:outer membrane beta-barrel family protein [Flavobacterium silvaticum]NMH28071.1 TonB-dependent receptor [Flavobacterium silvaticum]
MKKLLFFALILLSGIGASAQTEPVFKGSISGVVIDSTSNKPVDYASVSLYKADAATPINGVITDANGNFKIDGVVPGNYKIGISFIGYQTKNTKTFTIDAANLNYQIGKIILSAEVNTLNEVVVQGSAALVSNKIDKIVYNVEKDVTASGGSATDVLQKVPLVSVDIDGNVSVRGDANVRILINGKPTGATSSNVSDVLKSIPADQIKNVEVVTAPSAKYDAEGSGGIINIITKQKSVSGINGSVSGGVGTRQNNFNANINYNKGKFSLSANIGSHSGWPQTSDYNSSQQFNDGTTNTLQTANGTSKVNRFGMMGSVTAGYEIDSTNSISSTFRLNKMEFSSDGNSQNIFTDYNDASNNNTFTGKTRSVNKNEGFDWNLDYLHKFSKEGHELTFSTQWSHSKVNTDYTNQYSAFYTDQKAFNDGTNNEYTLQLDYSLPITEKFKVEAGGKSIFRRISSDFTNYVPDANGNFTYDPISSNLYDYSQDVLAGYAVGTLTLPKGYTVMAGARIENTSITGNPTNALQTDLQRFENTYSTFIPSFTLQKSLTDKSSLKLTYSKRITRPSLTYLNPFINKSNIQAQTQGNPNLDPEISQTVELGYSTFSQKRTLSVSAYYKYTSGLIEGIATPLDGESGTITNYQNIGNNKSFGMSLFGSVNPFKILTIRGNVNAYTYKPDPSGVFLEDATQNGTYVQYNAFVSGTLAFENGLSAEAFVIQNSSRRTIQGTNPAFNLMVFGVKKQFWDKKASLGINVASPFRKDLSFKSETTGTGFNTSSQFNYPIRSFGITFSYNFGKMSFSDPSKGKKGVKNDDLKEGESNPGGMVPSP